MHEVSSAPLTHALMTPAQRMTKLHDADPHTLALPVSPLSKVDGFVDRPPEDTVAGNLCASAHLVHGLGNSEVGAELSAE